MLDAHDRILAGVSGGADSVCLLLVLKELGYAVAAAHLNHGLRGGAADEDEVFVKRLAETLDVAFFGKKVSLQGNVEAAGRQARKQFFAEISARHGFTKIALAHTQDDRVETFLMNMLRGSGAAGLVSMSPVSGQIVRPLIDTRRAGIESYLGGRGQDWRIDATNFDLSFARNRLRHEIIPRLAADFNPRLVDTLSRTINILEAEDAWLQRLAEDWTSRHTTTREDGIALNCRTLEAAGPGLARRVLRTVLRRGGSFLQDVSFDHIEAVRSLLNGPKSGKFVEIPGGWIAVREFDHLVIRRSGNPVADYEYELQIPGNVHIPELRKAFRAEILEGKCNELIPGRVLLDAESLGRCVRIRNWKPGDYYRPVGLPAGKLKKLFQRAGIPRNQRKSWPVFVTDSTIIWVASFPVSRDFAPGERAEKLVAIEAIEALP
jgi:tRNA(Ile)-lysidine synthase